ncbi:hypothetical protein [Eggerthia catenaformis]|uniref:hypothetical protein n=1 Tax=Eggerthia catenaformis TaxID=31973 RepID=UPI0028E928AF|nr:hypothetical protein [Eggerthia catenaformis]
MKNKFGIYVMIGLIFILFLFTVFYRAYSVLSYDYLGIYTYIFLSIEVLAYFVFAYIIFTRILFSLKFHSKGGTIYFFEGDKLYTSNHLRPIETDKIKAVTIKSTSKYRGNRAYKVSIKLKDRFFSYTFGIGHISRSKEQKLYDNFIKELKKYHIDYEMMNYK